MKESKNLLFTSVGSLALEAQLKDWSSSACFDIALVYFGSSEADFQTLSSFGLRYLSWNQDFKIPNFLHLCEKYPQLLEYQQIVFADDDIQLQRKALERFYRICERNEFHFAQPAHSLRSYVKYPRYQFLRHIPLLHYERVSFIEIQFFLVKGALLREHFEELSLFRTGYGLDVFLSYHLAKKGLSPVLVHAVQMLHHYRPERLTVRALHPDFAKEVRRVEDEVLKRIAVEDKKLQELVHFESRGAFCGSTPVPSVYPRFIRGLLKVLIRMRLLGGIPRCPKQRAVPEKGVCF